MRCFRGFLASAPMLAICAIGLGGVAVAAAAAPGTPDSAERNLMIKASQSNLAEIEEGRIALTNSKNPEVQALGNRLVQDHTKAEDTLEALAASMSVNLPAKPDSAQEQEIGKLRSMKGAAFDDVFDHGEVTSHEQTIAQLHQAESNVHNAALKAWIAQNVPVLEQYLQIARSLPGASGSNRTAQTSQPPSSAARGAAAKPDRADTELLTKSMQGNLAEIELGRLAVTHSTNPVVQGLGTRLAQDGSKGVANLQALAGMLEVDLPSTPNSEQEHQLSELGKLHGARFDSSYQRTALTDERKFLRAFQSGVSAAQNPAVKATIKNMVPVVQEHIAIAQAIPGQYPRRTAATATGTTIR